MKRRALIGTVVTAVGLGQGVFAAVFTDTFDAAHDYLAGGVTGTLWDGFIYNVNGGDAIVTAANANTANAAVLTFQSNNGNWENADDDGLLLYKEVTGNFTAVVRVVNMNTVQWHDAGLMARVAGLADAGAGEDYVAARYFAAGNANALRSVNDNVTANQTAVGLQPWLRLARSGDTFTVSRSTNGTDWVQVGTVNRPDLAGLPLQVGLWQATFSANPGVAQMDDFTLTVPEGPTITQQPFPRKTMVGGTVSFSVAALGIEPLEYQWRHDGTDLPGQINATLTLTDVQSADAGLYRVLVTDADGTTASEETLLTVYESGQLFEDDFEAYHDYSNGDVAGTIWEGIVNAENLDPGSDTADGVLHWRNTGEGWDTPAFYNGPFLYKLVAGNFDAEIQNIDTVNVDYSDGGLMVRVPNLDDAGPGEDWVTLKYFNSICCGEAVSVRSCDGGPPTQTGTFPAGSTFLRLERRGPKLKFYGKVNANDPWTLGYAFDRPDLADLALQVGLQHGTYSANPSDRQFDNFSLYLPSGPVITTQPLSQEVVAGDPVTFAVTATGIEPLEFQWQHDGTNIPGAIETTLTLNQVTLEDAGTYLVAVTDADGTSLSEPAVLSVIPSMGMLQDNFDTFHDYTGGNVAGTIWDGVLNAQNLEANSDTAGGVLHWRNRGDGWENANATGPFLYKLVSGDFNAQAEVAQVEYVQWSDGGLMARVPNVADAGPGEDYVTVMLFSANNVDAWATQNRLRSTDNDFSTSLWTSGINGHRFLRLQRIGNVFNSYTKAAEPDPWILRETITRTDMPEVLQVGFQHGTFVDNPADRQFDNFLLNGPNVVGPITITRQDNTVRLSWQGKGLVLEHNSDLSNPAGWSALEGVSGNEVTLPLDSGKEFFRLRTP